MRFTIFLLLSIALAVATSASPSPRIARDGTLMERFCMYYHYN
ncbi:20438_t:CDS:2 [Rhizophagus irregularis]|nr:20438_t:CDS:2 [Rhizophagus irregularis]